MTLLELLHTCSFEELLPYIPCGHETGFRRMYDELQTIKPDHHPDYSIIHLTNNRELCEKIDNRQRADDDAHPLFGMGFELNLGIGSITKSNDLLVHIKFILN